LKKGREMGAQPKWQHFGNTFLRTTWTKPNLYDHEDTIDQAFEFSLLA